MMVPDRDTEENRSKLTEKGRQKMAAAYIFMNIESGKVGKAHTAIKGIKGVREAHIVAGPYDIIAFIEANTLEQLSQRILVEIQTISGVRSTATAIVFQ